MQHFELGTMVKDTVSGSRGMLTHLSINADRNFEYVFQPHGLNPDTGEPVERLMIETARIQGGKLVETDIPLDVLLTEAEDIGTGFKGVVVGLILHINGCLHANVKPKGKAKDKSTFKAWEFDMRRLKGPAIPVLTKKELADSKEKTPSPSGGPVQRRK